MTFLRAAVRIELALLAAGFAVIVAWKLLRGAVRWFRSPGAREELSRGAPGALRLQMLAVTLLVALLYVVQFAQAAASGRLPAVPGFALALLAGSQTVFLGTEARRLLHQFMISKRAEEK